MKTFTLQRFLTICFSILLLFSWSIDVLSQEILNRDGNDYIKVDLNQHSPFSTALIVSFLSNINDAKVRLSDEKGIAYIYPSEDNFHQLYNSITAAVKDADFKELLFDNGLKAKMSDSIAEIYGEWIIKYAHSGILETENDSCHRSFPFCTGTVYTFPAGVNTSAQHGPYYQCLGTQPNPAWYHLKIESGGPIAIYMHSTPQRDIDFCLWGPFTNPITPCPMTNTQGGLTPANVEDCSFSSSWQETANIANGQPGEYYILIITNYSNQPCNVTFEQTGGSGTTDCTILPPPATSNSPLCVGESLELHAANVNDAQYHWTGPNGFTSNEQNPVLPNVTFANAGEYELTITINGQGSEPTSTMVDVVNPPVGSLSGGGIMCQGDSVMLTLTCNGPTPYRALLSTGPGFPWVVYFDTTEYNFYTDPSISLTYNLIGIRNAACDGTFSGTAPITVNPRPQTNFSVTNPCADLSTQFTDLTIIDNPGLLASWLWNFDDLGTSTAQNPTHTYANQGNYDVSLTVIANNGCSKTISQPLDIKPTPVVNAGTDVSTGYGTDTQLNGTASGGSGFHTYLWTPSDKVVNETQLVSMTELLTTTTEFTLTATDVNGCENDDEVTVTITGGPLSSIVSVSDDKICYGEETTLEAVPTGGSGFYTYSWTSNPPGFTSDLKEITVMPFESTTYHCAVFDNFNTFNASKQVIVNENPVVHAIDDFTIPYGTSTTLTSTVTGGHPFYQYQWGPLGYIQSPASATTQTTNLYNSQIFNIKVTDAEGCEGGDIVSVSLSGGPLSTNPTAVDSVICRYETTQVRALAGGGSGNYTFQWTSKPAGFTSADSVINVTPSATTMYYVKVDDGYNIYNDSVQVKVNQLPVIDLIDENNPIINIMGTDQIGLCVFDSLVLDAANSGCNFLWSNGLTSQTNTIATSGISYDMQVYSVQVTNPSTGCVNDSELTIYFNFSNCSYGIEENDSNDRIRIYPNPSENGVFSYELMKLKGSVNIQVFTSYGKLISENEYRIPTLDTFKGELDLSQFAAGVYFFRLVNDDAVLLKQLIIQ